LDVAAEEGQTRQRPVADPALRGGSGHTRREVYGEPAVRSVDAHRVQDLSRIDADSGTRPHQSGPVDGEMQAERYS
jgi:hypothetical protein